MAMKGCIEGEAALCSLLQKGCAAAKVYGGQTMLPEESLLCQSIETVCPSNLNGLQVFGSICVQKSTHVCEAAPQICEALMSADPSQKERCLQTFASICPQVRM